MMSESEWTLNQLKKLGKCIQLEQEAPENLPAYDDVMLFYNDVAAETQELIRSLDWDSLLQGRAYEVTSRPKTIDTLREKLQRETTTPLPNIQDIAGVRFEAEMTLDEQDAVVTAITGLFDHDPKTAVRDLRVDDHCGYRAVHVWLRLPTRVEVQVRTHLQGEWANMYESLADVYGREIRYGALPVDPEARALVEGLQFLSTVHITQLEFFRNSLAGGPEALGLAREAYRKLPRGKRRRHRLKFEKDEKAFLTGTRDLHRMETDLRAMMGAGKEAFDTMRSNGRK